MPYRTIKQWPHKDLRKTSEVATLEDIIDTSKDLIDTLRVVRGAGLAAPQIGLHKKVFVIDVSKFECENPDGNGDFWVVANPEISNCSGSWKWKEACLSVPMVSCMVERFEEITLAYDDLEGNRKTIELKPPLSLGVQHEADHLDGKTILDRINKFQSDMYKRRIRKAILRDSKFAKKALEEDVPKIGRSKKKNNLSNQEVKKRKRNRRRNQNKK